MGGSRFAGLAIVRRLLERGQSVTTFNRGTHPVDWHGNVSEIHGDRDDPEAMAKLRSLPFDGVIDMSAYTTAQTRGLLDVLGDVPRLVHCSSGAIYQPQPVLPWPEETPHGPWPVWGAYSKEKLGCELLLRRRRLERGATTAIRLPYVLGPANFADREEFVLNRLLDTAEILIPGDGLGVQQFVSVSQVGHAMVAALETFDAGDWRVFNIASPEFTSLVGFVEICAEVAGADPLLRFVGGGATDLPGGVFNRFEAVFPFPNLNYVLDVTASVRAGIAPPPVSLREMIAESFEFLQSHPERRAWTRTAGERQYFEGV
jgi:nucleoside-diphosphate-sugar epimerase